MKNARIPQTLKREYESLRPVLDTCRAELQRIIRTQLRKVQNPQLVRARMANSRVKSLPSVWDKARRKKWRTPEILKRMKDLVGFRIVCNNLEDARRIKEVLLSSHRIEEIGGLAKDRLLKPTSSGYRDLKFHIEYRTGNASYVPVMCEIQIRTLIQDSWAILVHKDIYKEGEELPKSLKKRSYRLSELLRLADRIAQDIRAQVSEKKEPSKRTGKLVNEDTLRVLFKKVFGELPTDYLVQLVRNKCGELGIRTIEPLEEVLLSVKSRQELREAYQESTGWNISDELIFEFSPVIAVSSLEIGKDAINKRGKQQWSEIDQTYRGEILSELPDTFEEFLEYLEPHTKHDYEDFPDRVYRLAEVFNAMKECSLCGVPTVDEDALAQNAQEHYGVEDLEGRIQSAVLDSGTNADMGGLCPYHADVMGD